MLCLACLASSVAGWVQSPVGTDEAEAQNDITSRGVAVQRFADDCLRYSERDKNEISEFSGPFIPIGLLYTLWS